MSRSNLSRSPVEKEAHKASQYKIACIVVTYNRKELLIRCLNAIASQTLKPSAVYITDNASTDGTMEHVKRAGYYECERNGIAFRYILNSKNEGGAGGFYLGMKTAYEEGGYDGLWVMDDDGEPESQCLEYLTRHLSHLDYLSPAVLSDEDHRTMSFTKAHESFEEFCKQANKEGLVYDWANPFNGILFSSRLIKKIGFPKKEMFIWGDELNYHLRAKHAGMEPYTIVKAIHYHPIDRQTHKQLGKFKSVVIGVPDWKLYCYLRNTTYNLRYTKIPLLRAPKRALCTMKTYLVYYNKVEKDHSKNFLIVEAILSGLIGRFSGMKKYMR